MSTRNGNLRLPATKRPSARDDSVAITFQSHASFPQESLELRTNGARLTTRWPLLTGTEVALGLQVAGDRVDVSGVVVHCRPCCDGAACYEVTVFFTGLTPAQEREIARAAARLA